MHVRTEIGSFTAPHETSFAGTPSSRRQNDTCLPKLLFPDSVKIKMEINSIFIFI